MNFRPYRTQRDLAEDFGLNYKTIAARLKELRELSGRYGTRSVIDDGNIVLVYFPAFADYLSNRRMLLDKNLSKFVKPYDPGEIIRELGMREWEAEPAPPQKIDKEELRKAVREILMEGIA